MKDIEKTVLEARDQFETLLAYLDTASDQPYALHEVERDIWDGLLALGRTLLLHFVQQKDKAMSERRWRWKRVHRWCAARW